MPSLAFSVLDETDLTGGATGTAIGTSIGGGGGSDRDPLLGSAGEAMMPLIPNQASSSTAQSRQGSGADGAIGAGNQNSLVGLGRASAAGNMQPLQVKLMKLDVSRITDTSSSVGILVVETRKVNELQETHGNNY